MCKHSIKTISLFREIEEDYDDEQEEETAQEKRLRLAKKYLQEIEEEGIKEKINI